MAVLIALRTGLAWHLAQAEGQNAQTLGSSAGSGSPAHSPARDVGLGGVELPCRSAARCSRLR